MANQLADIRRHFKTPTKSEYHLESFGRNHNTLSVSPTKRRTKALGEVENGSVPKRSKLLRGARIDSFCKPTKFLRREPFSEVKDCCAARPSRAELALLSRPTNRSPIRHRPGLHGRNKALTKSPNARRATALHSSNPSPKMVRSNSLPSAHLAASSKRLNDQTFIAPNFSSKRHPTSWFFEIHEDTDEERGTNYIPFETYAGTSAVHDASFPEIKDMRDKENIPPVDAIFDTFLPPRNPSRSSVLMDIEMEAILM
ncbi:hypothetical protein K3495_g7173 [Podosphaera aphanis]|nr:hypothetical protein K3495_g7173 [Podosphaera aphanis]